MNFYSKSICKINLFLKITGKREDGYHDIETIFLPLSSPSDTVTINFKSAKGISIKTDHAGIPADESNICWKAGNAFAKFADIDPEWEISIKKNIPVAAGLGGGSSNAGSTLRLLQEKFPVVDDISLGKIAVETGADVPYFLNPVPSIATGVGERLTPLKAAKSIELVLVNPKFPVSSSWAYKNRIPKQGNAPGIRKMAGFLESGDIHSVAANLYNELSFALYSKFPALEIIKESLLGFGALGAEISGSGPTIFAVSESAADAERISEKIKNKFGDAIACMRAKS